jgi:hypothetical protein
MTNKDKQLIGQNWTKRHSFGELLFNQDKGCIFFFVLGPVLKFDETGAGGRILRPTPVPPHPQE